MHFIFSFNDLFEAYVKVSRSLMIDGHSLLNSWEDVSKIQHSVLRTQTVTPKTQPSRTKNYFSFNSRKQTLWSHFDQLYKEFITVYWVINTNVNKAFVLTTLKL